LGFINYKYMTKVEAPKQLNIRNTTEFSANSRPNQPVLKGTENPRTRTSTGIEVIAIDGPKPFGLRPQREVTSSKPPTKELIYSAKKQRTNFDPKEPTMGKESYTNIKNGVPSDMD
jgi:hypothetical protein